MKPSNRFAFFRRRPRVYVLPTGAGFAFMFLILALIFMSAVYASPSLQFLGFFLFALFTLSFAWTHSNVRALSELAFDWDDGFASESTLVRLRVRSGAADARQGLEIKLHLRGEQPVSGRRRGTLTTEPFELAGKGSIDRAYTIELKIARGRWRMHRITIGSSAPFGLATAWMSVNPEADLFVYPRRLAVEPRAESGSAWKGAGVSPGEENFRTLAESPWMTSALHVVPKPAANEGVIVVKRFEGEEAGVPLVEWPTLEGDFETKLSRCAEALSRPEPILLRTPFFEGITDSAAERRRGLRSLAEASP